MHKAFRSAKARDMKPSVARWKTRKVFALWQACRLNANEVSLDLVVHDKKDQAVFDLKPDEIEVFDAGSPVTLNSLRLVFGKPERDCLVTLVFGRLNPNLMKTSSATDIAAGQSIRAAVAIPWGVYESVMKTARHTATEILKIIPGSGFSIAVTGVEWRLRVEQRFTSDRKAIAQAINAVTQLSKPTGSNDLSQPEREVIITALTGADPSGKAVGAGDRAPAEALTAAIYNTGPIAQELRRWLLFDASASKSRTRPIQSQLT